MSKIAEIPWIIEEPTKIKHQLLNDYLGAWISILYSNQSLIGKEKKLIYVDGFSGPGEYWADETKSSRVNGSPILAAEKANKYIDEDGSRKFLIIAIDSEKRCIEHLQPILVGINKHKQEWQVLHTTFEQGMDELFGYLEANNARIAPAFFSLIHLAIQALPWRQCFAFLNTHAQNYLSILCIMISIDFYKQNIRKNISNPYSAPMNIKMPQV